MIEIDKDELHTLREKARAFDQLIKNRLHEGYVPGSIDVRLKGITGDKEVVLQISGWTMVTPFGKAIMSEAEGGYTEYYLKEDSMVRIDTLVRLQLN